MPLENSSSSATSRRYTTRPRLPATWRPSNTRNGWFTPRPLWRTATRPGVSRPLHPSCGHLQPPLPAARFAARLTTHPLLRLPGQLPPQGQTRSLPSTAGHGRLPVAAPAFLVRTQKQIAASRENGRKSGDPLGHAATPDGNARIVANHQSGIFAEPRSSPGNTRTSARECVRAPLDRRRHIPHFRNFHKHGTLWFELSSQCGGRKPTFLLGAAIPAPCVKSWQL